MQVRCLCRVGGQDRVHEIGEVIVMTSRLAAEHIAAGNVEAVEAPAAPSAPTASEAPTAEPRRKR